MKNKKRMIILLILSFIFFLAIYSYLTIMTIHRYYLLGLLFIVPFLIIGIIEFLYFRNIIKQKITNYLLIITIISSLILEFTGLVFITINDLLSEVTDIDEYDRIMLLEKNTSFINHFPEIIPSSAKNINFYYRPQSFQGGMEFQLHMSLPKGKIENYIKKYSNNCIKILDTNNIDSLNNFGIFNVGNYILFQTEIW